jgi:CTP:molybdopterin cytidylyltransferase MocA
MLVGIILAAGSGSRMGQPKATVEINGERLVDRAVSTFRDAGITHIYVVLGAWQGDVPHAEIVVNNEWHTGMGSSLRAGLTEVTSTMEFSAAIVSLVDLPGLNSAAVQLVAESSSKLAMGTFHGKPGHPVKFDRQYWPEIIAHAINDTGARNFLKGRQDVDYISLDHLATGEDVDSPEDLQGWI